MRISNAMMILLLSVLSLTGCKSEDSKPANQSPPVVNQSSVPITVVNRIQEPITGNMTDKPIAGALVVIDQGGPANTYTTDASGKAMVPGINSGLHDLHVFADGYTWTSIYQYTVASTGNTISLQPTAISTPPTLTRGYAVLQPALPAGSALPTNGGLYLSFTDSYGQTNYTQAYNNSSWDPYTSMLINTVTANLSMYVTSPYANVTGSLDTYMVNCDIYGFNCMKTDYNTITNLTLATSPDWGTAAPAVVSLVATAAPYPVSKPGSQAVLDLNLSNSSISPGSVIDPALGSPGANIYFTTTDANGKAVTYGSYISYSLNFTTDPYSGAVIRTVSPGAATTSFNLKDIPVGSTVAGTVSIEEYQYDNTTYTRTTTNFIDLGMQTFTTTETPYTYTLNKLPSVNPTLNVTLPAMPPAPSTVLAINSITPPAAGMITNGMLISDFNSYIDIYTMLHGAPHTFPYTATSFRSTDPLITVSLSASDPYSSARWRYTNQFATGSSVDITSAFTSLPSISPYNQNGTISFDLLGAIYGGFTIYDPYSNNSWSHIVSGNSTSITLPTVPASITNPWLPGTQYGLQYSVVDITGQTFNSILNLLLSNTAPTVQTLQSLSVHESITLDTLYTH